MGGPGLISRKSFQVSLFPGSWGERRNARSTESQKKKRKKKQDSASGRAQKERQKVYFPKGRRVRPSNLDKSIHERANEIKIVRLGRRRDEWGFEAAEDGDRGFPWKRKLPFCKKGTRRSRRKGSCERAGSKKGGE